MRIGIMAFVAVWAVTALMTGEQSQLVAADNKAALRVGFGETDITPTVGGEKPVYIAGYGRNRKAEGVHDPLKIWAVVMHDGNTKIALISIDCVGVFHPHVEQIREKLPGFDYVLVSATHNHEGPDTMGLWGEGLKSGVDPDYIKFVQSKAVEAVRAAEKDMQPARATIGKARDASLIRDSREPYVIHDEMVVLQFENVETNKPIGLLVQWNCHPEHLGSRNKLITADYTGYTVNYLKGKYGCPVAYFTGTVGGLMTTLGLKIKDEDGKVLPPDSFEGAERYGILVGQLADKAIKARQSVDLAPFDIRSKIFYVEMENAGFKTYQWMGVFDREAYVWTGDPNEATLATKQDRGKELALRTEVALLNLGQVGIACIPGEIYPELVLDKVQDPVDPGADFPDAPIEPAIYKQMKTRHKMIFGLANDEIGYILPLRQWDVKKPYCYGRKRSQYGEINSIGPSAGPVICEMFKQIAVGK